MSTSLKFTLPGRRLGRAVAHRWPALLGAAVVTAAVPIAALAADFNGLTTFTNTSGTAVKVTSGYSSAIVADGQLGITAIGEIHGVQASGDFTGVSGKSTGAAGTGVYGEANESENSRGVQGRSYTGTGVEAHGLKYGLKADANDVYGVGVQASGTLIGVQASGKTDAVTAVGDKKGVYAHSTNGLAVDASSVNGDGLTAEGNRTAGSWKHGVLALGDEAVVARGTTMGVDATANGTAVAGVSNNEVGGYFAGKEAPIRLAAASTAGAPTIGPHHRGELYVDSNGLLYYCTADGTPGTWKKVHLD
jgi:hypothetical protein